MRQTCSPVRSAVPATVGMMVSSPRGVSVPVSTSVVTRASDRAFSSLSAVIAVRRSRSRVALTRSAAMPAVMSRISSLPSMSWLAVINAVSMSAAPAMLGRQDRVIGANAVMTMNA